MCKQTAYIDENLLSYWPGILNLQCYIENPTSYASFSAYNAEIREAVRLWGSFLGHVELSGSTCNAMRTELFTQLALFYLY